MDLNCWDGEDGVPVVFLGHTLTDKLSLIGEQLAGEDQHLPLPVTGTLSVPVHVSVSQMCW